MWEVQGRHLTYENATVSLGNVSLYPEGWLQCGRDQNVERYKKLGKNPWWVLSRNRHLRRAT